MIQAEDSSVASEVAKYALPPAKGDVKLIDAENIDELIILLKNEAKAIKRRVMNVLVYLDSADGRVKSASLCSH